MESVNGRHYYTYSGIKLIIPLGFVASIEPN